jgi:hypothetical protein
MLAHQLNRTFTPVPWYSVLGIDLGPGQRDRYLPPRLLFVPLTTDVNERG